MYQKYCVVYWFLGTLYKWHGYSTSTQRAVDDCCASVGCVQTDIYEVVREES